MQGKRFSCLSVFSAALAMLFMAGASATEYHVTPTGKAEGDGSVEKPWDITSALVKTDTVKGGDTIWVHGGDYNLGGKAITVKLQGAEKSPIIVRNWKNERATMRSTIHIGFLTPDPVKHVWFWGLESQNRGAGGERPYEIGNSQFAAGLQSDVKIINCIGHDCPGNGLGCWGSSESEVHGCLVYNNGGDAADRGHGHGFYVQSKTHKEFKNNITFRNFCWGIQVYGTGAACRDGVTLEGNVWFNNNEISHYQKGMWQSNIYLGGGGRSKGLRVIENYSYVPSWPEKGVVVIGNSDDTVFKGNYFVSPGPDKRVALDLDTLGRNEKVTMTDNTFIGLIVGFTPDQFGKGNVHIPERPKSGKKIVIRKNGFEEGRANIIVYNWDKSDTVDVDVKEAGLKEGEEYEVRDAQNWYSKAIVTGKYGEKPVTIPMTGLTVAAPIGLDASYKTPPHTAPEFGVFVIMKKGAAAAGN
jgi:hypothetical protein